MYKGASKEGGPLRNMMNKEAGIPDPIKIEENPERDLDATLTPLNAEGTVLKRQRSEGAPILDRSDSTPLKDLGDKVDLKEVLKVDDENSHSASSAS